MRLFVHRKLRGGRINFRVGGSCVGALSSQISMRSVKLLHISDVHFPDRRKKPVVEWKDRSLSGSWVSRLVPEPFKKVADELRKLLLEDPLVRGVLLSGDLTSSGDITGYRECVTYLGQLLELGDAKLWADKTIAVVPGNHDVVRHDVDTSGNDLGRKFSGAEAAWNGLKPGVFSPTLVHCADIVESGNHLVRVLALNTCMGCGEKRFLPESIRDQIHNAMMNYVSTASAELSFGLIGEQLDTPAVLEDHVAQVECSIKGLATCAIPVVVGHHPLLPQARLRIELYTELINGGRFRTALATLGTNVLYCHGHIHEDPVEVVSHPVAQHGRLVLIAAPMFSEGFNVIELIFTDTAHPIGCAVFPYRAEHYGSVRQRPAIRIPLQPIGHSEMLCDQTALRVLQALGRELLRFNDLAGKVRPITPETLRSQLEMLEWLSVVEIRNRFDAEVYWHIRRIGP